MWSAAAISRLGELHERAHAKLQRAGKITTLDTTGLVHECYLRLSGVGRLQGSDRVHFLCYAASAGAAVPGLIRSGNNSNAAAAVDP
jgi:hypothetical protein